MLKSIVVVSGARQRGLFPVDARYRASAGGACPEAPATTLKLTSEVPASQRGAPLPAADDPTGAAGIAGAGGGDAAQPGVATPRGAAPSVGSAAALLTNVKRCISVGPFRDVSETAHAASTLRSGGYDPRQRVAEGEVWAGVWVYLPIPPSQSSEQMLSKLKAAGIDDALEMPGPNESSVISLGLYGDQKRAQTRVRRHRPSDSTRASPIESAPAMCTGSTSISKPTDSVLKPSDLQSETGHIQRLEVKACPSAGATP